MNVISGAVFLGILLTSSNNAYENNYTKENIEILDNSTYEEIALSYLKFQYKFKSINYDTLDVIFTNDLMNENEIAVGKVVIVCRDSNFDYVILNCITKSVDEFSLNCHDAVERFSNKVFYTGLMNYYKESNYNYVGLNKSQTISKSSLKRKSEKICKKWKRIQSESNPNMPSSKDGWNGFYDWNSLIETLYHAGYSNNEWRYLDGITTNGVNSGLYFDSQTTFNNYFDCDNSCGPTACTNMFKWFNYKKIKNKNSVTNALKNGNKYDTFARFRQLLKHDVYEATYPQYYNDAIKTYAKEQGYSYEIDRYIDTYEEFKENIDKGMPVLTRIQLDADDWGAHRLLVVGYESFALPYTQSHSFLGLYTWTTTEYKYVRYLRVIDGWSSSNDSVYIDVSGYWDELEGVGFRIYG